MELLGSSDPPGIVEAFSLVSGQPRAPDREGTTNGFPECALATSIPEYDEATPVIEYAYILWTAETADNVYEMATDTFVVRDGKILAQSFAAKLTPKG